MDELTVEAQPEKKKIESGVVYMSYVPPFMTVKKVRELLGQHGTLGKIFLQPDKKRKQGKVSKFFTEGWIEFTDKKVAKRVAHRLNRQQIGGKRKSPYFDSLWSLKYLSKFRWVHLNERLAYEKATRDQKMRIEISQAKREANYYIHAAGKSKALRERKHKSMEISQDHCDVGSGSFKVPKQKPTDDEVRKEKEVSQRENSSVLLSKIFGNKEL